MDNKKQLGMLNKMANSFGIANYDEIKKIDISLSDNGNYLIYEVYMDLDLPSDSDQIEIDYVISELDIYFLIDDRIISTVKSFHEFKGLPLNNNYQVIVYNKDGDIIFNHLEMLRGIYKKDPFLTGGQMYRKMMGL